MTNVHKLFQKFQGKRITPDSSYKANIAVTAKPDADALKNCQATPLRNTVANILFKCLQIECNNVTG